MSAVAAVSKPPAYIDTSALVKRFITESKTDDIEQFLIAQSHQCVLSSLSLTELKSVLQRRKRDAQITEEVVQLSQQQVMLELAQGSWHSVAISEPLFIDAGKLIAPLSGPLAALDALHLACAKTARCQLMASADNQLLRAAAEAGLQTFNLS